MKRIIITKLIRAITLYDKIANSEKVPLKVKYNNIVYLYLPCMHDYVSDIEEDNCDYLFDELIHLSDYVEIIEDTQKDVNITLQGTKNSIRKSIGLPPIEDKKINSVDITGLNYNQIIILFANRLNELIDKANGE